MPITSISIASLYEAVWHTPLKKLGDNWQLHPHALGQLLDRLGIPRPPNGYWTQKAVGKTVEITPLPEELSGDRLIDLSSLQSTLREKAKLGPSPLPPPRKTLGRYPLLKGIKGSLNKPYHQYDYILTQSYDDTSVLRLDVSAEQKDRAISILHRLMSKFEECGWSVRVQKPRYEKRLHNVVTINDVDIPFRLRERLKQTKRELSDKEKAEKARREWVWKENINIPSGILQLYVEGPLIRGMKSMFEDRASLVLEDQLGAFVEHMQSSAEYSKVLEKEREEQQRQWQAERNRQVEYERSIKEEKARIESFLSMFQQWQKAQECRKFIESVVDNLKLNRKESQMQAWRNWTESIADALDPLKSAELEKIIDNQSFNDSEVFGEAMFRIMNEH